MQTRFGARPEIEVRMSAARPRELRDDVAASVVRMLGLERDLSSFYRLARDDSALRPLAERLRGMKPVRYPTVFEAFANAVACQLVSLSAGMHVLNRVTEKFGKPTRSRGVAMRSFARAEAVARTTPDALRALGLSRQKGQYLINLARLAADRKDRDFGTVGTLDDEAAIECLSKIRGVGRWTAEYVLLRGFGRINVFPGDDVGGRNKLYEFLGETGAPDYAGVRRITDRWHPYGGLIYLHLLVNGLIDAGHIAESRR
jgi:DNA-3-methyladenine glycosylase II